MDDIKDMQLRIALYQFTQCVANIQQFQPETFPAMGGDQDQPATASLRTCIRMRRATCDLQESVNPGVARNVNCSRTEEFLQEICTSLFGRSEMQTGQLINKSAVDFLGIRIIAVIGAKPRFDVRHRNPQVKGSERGGECRGRITLHDDPVRTMLQKILCKLRQNPRGKRSQVLFLGHDAQVQCRANREQIQSLVQQFSMLPRHNDALHHTWLDLQAANYRSQFDGFRARPEYRADLHLTHAGTRRSRAFSTCCSKVLTRISQVSRAANSILCWRRAGALSSKASFTLRTKSSLLSAM